MQLNEDFRLLFKDGMAKDLPNQRPVHYKKWCGTKASNHKEALQLARNRVVKDCLHQTRPATR